MSITCERGRVREGATLLRLLFRAGLVALLLILIAGASLTYWLSRWPVSLDLAKEQVERALPTVIDGARWQVDSLDLAWTGWHRGVQLRAHRAQLLDESDSPVLSLPTVDMRLALRPLLTRGEVALRTVALAEPRLHLTRLGDGRMVIGMQSPLDAAPEAAAPEPRLDFLPWLLRQDPRTALRRVSIDAADIVVDDQEYGIRWHASRLDVDIGRLPDGLVAAIDAALEVDRDTLHLAIQARLDAAGDRPLEVVLNVDEIPIRALRWLWPENAARSARKWVLDNITVGRVTDGEAAMQAHLDLTGAAEASAAAPRFRLDDIEGSFGLDGLDVRFLDTMPRVTGVQGSAVLSKDGFDFTVRSAQLRTITVGPARVVISGLARDRARIAIDAPVAGPLSEALAILDHEPLHLAQDMKLRPETVAGTMSGNVGFDFRLDGDIDGSELGLQAHAKTSAVAIPDAILDWSATDGELDVEVDSHHVRVEGHGRLEGVPIALSWREELDRASEQEREIHAGGVVDTAGRKALGFDFDWIDGPATVDVRVVSPRAGDTEVALKADLAESRLEIAELGLLKPPGQWGTLAADLQLRDEQLRAIPSLQLQIESTAIAASAEHSRGQWRKVDARGELQGAPFTFHLHPETERERFELRSSDAAALARAVGLYSTGEGGQVEIEGTIDLDDAHKPFASTLEVRDITARKAPTLAKLLTLASVQGIQEAFGNKGTLFSQVTARIEGDSDSIAIREGAAVGKSLTLLIDGKLDRKLGEVDLEGTLVPAYYGLNRLLGNLPVLGSLLSDEKEGVLAIDFTVRGPAADPEVAVDPVRTLTPSALRNLARLLSGRGEGSDSGDQ